MIYKSKVDWWMAIILIFLPVWSIGMTIFLYSSNNETEGQFALVITAAIFILYFVFVFPIKYKLGEEQLIIRFGLIHSSIPYKSIKSVKPSRNPLSAPALSLDRLAIDFGKFLPALISPVNKQDFLKELAKHTPKLKLVDDRLVDKKTEV